MITLEKNTDDWFIRDCCSSCHKKGEIYVITIWHTDINGTSICLCKDCLNNLKKKIEKITEEK